MYDYFEANSYMEIYLKNFSTLIFSSKGLPIDFYVT